MLGIRRIVGNIWCVGAGELIIPLGWLVLHSLGGSDCWLRCITWCGVVRFNLTPVITCYHPFRLCPVASLAFVSPGAVIATPPPKKKFLTFLKWKILQFLVFYTKKLKSSKKFPMTLFSFSHKRHVIYHTKFPLIFSLAILPTKFIFYHFTHNIYYFFPLGVTPWDSVTWGGGPPPPLDATDYVRNSLSGAVSVWN